MEDANTMDVTCLSCFRSHVKCEKSIPCRRCQRLGLRCVPNPRPRGRPKKSSFDEMGSKQHSGHGHGHGGGGGGGMMGGPMGGPPPPPPYHSSHQFQHPPMPYPGPGMVPPHHQHPMAMGMYRPPPMFPPPNFPPHMVGPPHMPPPHFGPGHPMQMPPSMGMNPGGMGNLNLSNNNNNNINNNGGRMSGPPPPPPAPPGSFAPGSSNIGGGGGGGGSMGGGLNNVLPDDDQNSNCSSSSSSSSYSSTSSLGDTPAPPPPGTGLTGGSGGPHGGMAGNGSSSSSSSGVNPYEPVAPSSITNPALREQVQRQLQLQHQQQQQREQQQREQQQHKAGGGSTGSGGWLLAPNQQPNTEARERGPPSSSGPSSSAVVAAAAGSAGAPPPPPSGQLIYPPFGRVGGGGGVGGGGPPVTSTSHGNGKSSSNKSSISSRTSSRSTSSTSSGSSGDEGGGGGGGSDDGSTCSTRSGDGPVSMQDAREGRRERNGNGNASSSSSNSNARGGATNPSSTVTAMATVAGDNRANGQGRETASMMEEDLNPAATAAATATVTTVLATVNGAGAVVEAGAPGSTALKMMGPFVNMLSGGEVAVERTRHLLTSWHLWSLEAGGGGNGSSSSSSSVNSSNNDPAMESAGAAEPGQAKEDLREVASLIRLNLPSSVAAWAESRGSMASAATATGEEEEQVQSFLDMCVDDDGSAICSAVYSGGRLQLTLNSRFAAMYMTLEELEATVARDKLRPELVWRRLLSPECSSAYDEALCQAYFKGQNLGGEACEIIKCVDRFGLEMPCFMRLRIFASSQGAITASVIFLLPLQLSRLVEAS